MKLKILDKFLLQAFVGPFMITFLIAIFVLIMQFLWLYIDDIIGKGASLLVIVEMIFYLSMSLVPMALPIAVLISSVMVMGNLAERYELSSFKSAGVPLMRVMRPLVFAGIGIALFSYICSDFLIPRANLKFQTRLYDIRKQKPTLSLEPGVFNDDFQGFTIRIGAKDQKEETIKKVLIYDNSHYDEKINMISAESGKMYNTDDKQYMIMDLFNGKQYQEVTSGANQNSRYPFVRTYFKEWHKVFDLSQFTMEQTDDQVFKNHEKMMNTWQLLTAVDTLRAIQNDREDKQYQWTKSFFTILKEQPKPLKTNDTIITTTKSLDTTYVDPIFAKKRDSINNLLRRRQEELERQRNPYLLPRGIPIMQNINRPLSQYKSWFETIAIGQQGNVRNSAISLAQSVQGQATATLRNNKSTKENISMHLYILHSKYSIAAMCFIFFLIGAPMGAIVHKGGFGYPILVAIIFFMIFWIMNIYCKNVAETQSMDSVLAAWLPPLIMLPIGGILTYRAMNDYKILNFDIYAAQAGKFFARLAKVFNNKLEK